MIIRQVLPLSLQCLDGNNFLQTRARRAAGHMFMWQLHLHNLKGQMTLFFSFKMTACCLQTMNNKRSRASSSICFYSHFFFPLLSYYYDPALVKQCLPCLRENLPAPGWQRLSPDIPPSAALPRALVSSGSSHWRQVTWTSAGAHTGNYWSPTWPQLQHPEPQTRTECACGLPTDRNRSSGHWTPSSVLAVLFLTIFSQIQESSTSHVSFLIPPRPTVCCL